MKPRGIEGYKKHLGRVPTTEEYMKPRSRTAGKKELSIQEIFTLPPTPEERAKREALREWEHRKGPNTPKVSWEGEVSDKERERASRLGRKISKVAGLEGIKIKPVSQAVINQEMQKLEELGEEKNQPSQKKKSWWRRLLGI